MRIPKVLLEESRLGDQVELVAEHERIIIRPVKAPRAGWKAAFKYMAENHDDELLDKGSLDQQNSWDDEEWIWE